MVDGMRQTNDGILQNSQVYLHVIFYKALHRAVVHRWGSADKKRNVGEEELRGSLRDTPNFLFFSKPCHELKKVDLPHDMLE